MWRTPHSHLRPLGEHHTAASIDKYLKNVGLSPGDRGCPQPLQTFRVVQALRNPMHNAACHCTSIEQLRALIHESDRSHHLLCSLSGR